MKKEQLSEDLRRMQELAGIITEAKSNDYYKKGMMSQNEGEAYGGYEDIMPKQRLAILQKLLAASEKDLQVAPGPKTQEVIDHLKQAIEALKGNMALSETNQGMRDTWDFNTFKQEVDIMAPGSGITQNGNKIVVVLKKSQWHNPKAYQTLINNYSKFIDKGQPFKGQFGEKGIVYTLKGGVA